MAIDCPACGESFRARHALCDDWRDPTRSLGCPRCGVFLIRTPGPDRTDLRAGVLAGAIGTPASMLLWHAWRLSDWLAMSYAVLILLGWAALMSFDLWGRSRRLVPSGHRRTVESPGASGGSSGFSRLSRIRGGS